MTTVRWHTGPVLDRLPVWWGAAIVLMSVSAGVAVYRFVDTPPGSGGVDFDTYMQATRQYVATGDFYLGRQLAAPYEITSGDILYPPISIWLFLPWVFLPAWLWWAIPLIGTAALLLAWRPHPLAWVGIAIILSNPWTRETIYWGNPNMWIMFAIAAGLRWQFPSVFVFVKPTLLPFALVGIRKRSWWLALCVLALLALPFGALWVEYATAIRNSNGGLAYSLPFVPMMLIPVAAWLARSRTT